MVTIHKQFFTTACLFLLFFWACRSSNSGRTRLDFWAMGAEGEHVQSLIDRFEREHPEIRVQVQAIPWSAAHEKLLTAFAGQSNPDLCQLGNTWIPEFQAMGAIRSLDDFLAASAGLDSTDFFPGIWRTNVLADKVYGIPWYVDTRLLFYRTDLLQKAGFPAPPATWEEWLQAARAVKSMPLETGPHYGVFFSLISSDWQVPVILILQNNGKLLRDNNRYAAFDDSATVAALRFYLTFFREGLAPLHMTEVANVYQGFGTGFFAMMVTGPWVVSEMRRRRPGLTGKWSTAPLPAGKNRNSVAGGASLVVFKNSRHPRAAWKLIEFLSRRDTQVQFFHLTRDLPSRKDAWSAPELRTDAQISAFFQQLQWVVPTPKVVEWEQIANTLQQYLEQAAYGRLSLPEAIARLNRDVNRILEKRRWLLKKGLIDF